MAKKTKKQKRAAKVKAKNKAGKFKKYQYYVKENSSIDKRKIESFFPDKKERLAYIQSLLAFFDKKVG